jgi:hypothetical protein
MQVSARFENDHLKRDRSRRFLRLFGIAFVLVRFDHVASRTISADQHHVIGCKTVRSRLRAGFRCTTADRMAAHGKLDRGRDGLCAGELRKRAAAYYFSMDTSVALIIAKTLSPTLRFIRLTEPVVIIDVTSPAAVLMVSSETTLSETILSIVPGSRFRMLVLMGIKIQSQSAGSRKACRHRTCACVLRFPDLNPLYVPAGKSYNAQGVQAQTSQRKILLVLQQTTHR